MLEADCERGQFVHDLRGHAVCSGFVGRGPELDRLAEYAAEVKAGHPRLVLVEGPAGIGKTSLVDASTAALDDGWLRLTVSGDEAEMRLPYGLLTRMLAGAGPRPRAGWSEPGPDEDPFVVGAELLQLLGDLDELGPAALIVDDAPFADSQSLRALAFALRRLQADRVLTVLTMRPEDAQRIPPGLFRHGQDHGTHLQLSGMSTQEIREIAATLGCGALSRRAAERLRDHTGGNPLYLRTLLKELPVEELRLTNGLLPAPSSFDRVVLAALADCSEPARCLLTAAAVLGVGCPLTSAAALAEVGEPLSALEAATSTGLVEARPRAEDWLVCFRHPLIRAAVYNDAGPATRGRLHARAATIVAEPDALVHRIAATEGPDPQLVAVLRARAAEDVRAGRLGGAADRLLAAARLSPPGAARDTLVLDAVYQLLLAGEVNEAAAYADRIAAMPDTGQRRLVHAQLAWLAGRLDEAEALALSTWVQGGQPAMIASAAAMLGQLRILRDDPGAAADWAGRALESGALPEAVTSTARINRAVGLGLSGHPYEGLRSLDLPADATEVPPERTEELWVRGGLRLWTDDVTGAFNDLRVGATDGPGVARPYRLIRLGYLSQVEFRTGAWDDSLLHAGQLVSLVTDTDQMWLLAFAHSVAVFVPAARGLWTEAETHMRAAADAAATLDDQASLYYAANAAVHMAAYQGDPAAVVEAAQPVASAPPRGGAHEPGVFAWPIEYAAALVALQRLDEAAAVLDRLAGVAEERGLRSVSAAVARVRGELAVAGHMPDEARESFEAALRLGADCASALDRARAHASYGGFLRLSGERQLAADQLKAAREGFAGLHAQPFLVRCDAELAGCGVAAGQLEGRGDARLTPQERAVARLVCLGRSNREIAAELVISVKTVGYHLGNAYTKLDVHSRTQLAAVLRRTDTQA